jgi:tetratricopeptide (TPR) repeat protein
MAASDISGAIAEAERTFTLAGHAGDATAQGAAMGMRSQAEFWAHDFDTALAHARIGYDLATSAGIGERGAAAAEAVLRCAYVEAATLTVLGRFDETEDALERGAANLGETAPRAKAAFVSLLDNRDNWQARWRPHIASMELEDDAFLAERVIILWTAGLHHAGAGDYLSALHELHRGLTICERTGELLGRVRILNTVGWVLGELGDDVGGREFNERSRTEAVPLGLPNREIEANAMLNLADAALVHGRLDEARDLLDDLEVTVRAPSTPEMWMLWRYSQRWLCASGELILAMGGDAQRAIALADECLEIAERTDSPKYAVRGRRLLGRALAVAGLGSEAVVELDRSLALARELGNPPQLWRSLLARAEVSDGAGCVEEAMDVMDEVVASLGDHPLAASMLSSPERPSPREGDDDLVPGR